jgi:type II secretory pathway component HofQ
MPSASAPFGNEVVLRVRPNPKILLKLFAAQFSVVYFADGQNIFEYHL